MIRRKMSSYEAHTYPLSAGFEASNALSGLAGATSHQNSVGRKYRAPAMPTRFSEMSHSAGEDPVCVYESAVSIGCARLARVCAPAETAQVSAATAARN